MASYAIRRVLWGFLLVLTSTALVFIIFYVFPSGDAAAIRAGRLASPEQVEQVRQALGLDQPFYVQYGIYLRDLLLHFDLGHSYQFGVPVTELISDRLPATLLLVGGSVFIWLGLGVLLGVWSAQRPGSFLDRSTGISSLFLLSAPVFWLGYLALILFAAGAGSLLPILPGMGAYVEADDLASKLAALILPCLVLGFSTAAVYVRLTRATMTEQLTSAHVTAARARGLPERSVVWAHAGRSGLSPMLTLVGIDVSLLLAGNVILIETVFNVPGIGALLTSSVERSDLPVIQGVVIVAAIFVVAANIVVDLIYAAIDPRVRLRQP
jgi:peptide/nickel transport system permease protein